VEHELLPTRIAEKIVVCPDSGCWLWTGCLTRDGYGQVKWEGTGRPVHRVVWTLLVGPIERMHVLDHLRADRPRNPGPCRHRNCCNPDHLEPVTVDVNSSRVESWNGKKRYCPQGHDYDQHGKTYHGADGRVRRFCATCRKGRDAERKGSTPADAPVARFKGAPRDVSTQTGVQYLRGQIHA
jgi:hypothetical protein